MLRHFIERFEATIVHVRRVQGHIVQRTLFEIAPVLQISPNRPNAAIISGQARVDTTSGCRLDKEDGLIRGRFRRGGPGSRRHYAQQAETRNSASP